MTLRKLVPHESEEFKDKFDTAQSIDQVLDAVRSLPGYIPLIDEYGRAFEYLNLEELRLKIQRIRHAQCDIGEVEVEKPSNDSDFFVVKAFLEAESELPSFAGIRAAVRRLLESDKTYQKSRRRQEEKTNKAARRPNQFEEAKRIEVEERARQSNDAKKKLDLQRQGQLAFEANLAQTRGLSRKERLRLENGRKQKNG